MSETAIKVNSIFKSYNIRERGYRSFREDISRFFRSIIRPISYKANSICNESLQSPRGRDYFWALKNVSFEVKKGEALGIIGANGSGKTTILRLLSKVTVPTKGDIFVTGKVAPLIQVGAGFHPELTGKENIYLNATIMGLTKREIDAKYNDIVSFSELDGFMDTPVKRYSSGMYVRLGFAVVANIDPDIFLIDEILSVGDLSFQRKCLDTMAKIRKSEKSIIFVSHNLSAVRGLCDRVIWLDKGEIRMEGTGKDVINNYTSYMTSKKEFIHSISFTETETRWGTGEIVFKYIEVLNNKYENANTFFVNDTMIVRLTYNAYKPITAPVFYVGILNMDEVWITGTTLSKETLGEGFLVEGEGKLECCFENLAIQPGQYCLQVGIFGEFSDIAYDRIGGINRFTVLDRKWDTSESYRGYEWNGVARIPNRWKIIEGL